MQAEAQADAGQEIKISNLKESKLKKMNKYLARQSATEKQSHNVLLDNFLLTMDSCQMDFENGVVLQCKRGKNSKQISQKDSDSNLSPENLSVEFGEPFLQSSNFFYIVEHADDQAPYQEKKMKITMVGTDGSGRKHTIGEVAFDMAEFVGATQRAVELESKSKPNKKIGTGVTLSLDITILKPAEYAAATVATAKVRRKKKKKEKKEEDKDEAEASMNFGNIVGGAMDEEEKENVSRTSFPTVQKKSKEEKRREKEEK